MTDAEPTVYITEYNDGSADLTISVDEEDHQFSVSPQGDTGIVTYEETLSWRGQVRVSEPRNEVYKLLMQSDEMTGYLEEHDLNAVRRKIHE